MSEISCDYKSIGNKNDKHLLNLKIINQTNKLSFASENNSPKETKRHNY